MAAELAGIWAGGAPDVGSVVPGPHDRAPRTQARAGEDQERLPGGAEFEHGGHVGAGLEFVHRWAAGVSRCAVQTNPVTAITADVVVEK